MARSKIYLGWLASCMFLAGCGKFEVDGHVFKVPDDHRITATIFFLPSSQSDGLHFILNPEAPLPKQHLGLLQQRAVTCANAEKAEWNMLFYACTAARQGRSWPLNGEVEKAYPDGFGKVLWVYVAKNGSGPRGKPLVASCAAMADGDGLCSSFGTYKDLVYSIGLRDSEMARLTEIHAKVRALFTSWEQ